MRAYREVVTIFVKCGDDIWVLAGLGAVRGGRVTGWDEVELGRVVSVRDTVRPPGSRSGDFTGGPVAGVPG